MSDYKLTIKNYQIIHNAQLTFHPGLTLITGKSNNGKSSIIKAFKQLVYNTPGKHYITHNSPSTTISLQHKDTTITYTSSPTSSSYTIKTPTNQTTLSKLGLSQPDQIKTLTNIDKQLNYNFWDQLTKPFLISLSPSQQFTLIQQSPHSIHLTNILTSLKQHTKTLTTTQLQHQSQLELLQQQSQQFTQTLTNLPTLESLHQQLTTLKSTNETLTTLNTLLDNYSKISLSPIQTRLHQLQSTPDLSKIQSIHTTITTLNTTYSRLLHTTNPINSLTSKIHSLQQSQQQTQQLLSHFTTCPLCNQPFNPLSNQHERSH